MTSKKREWASAEAVPPRHHRRYFTRSRNLPPHSSPPSDFSRVANAERKAKDQGFGACRKRRKGERQTPFLTGEIIFKILLLLPAKFLYEVARYVCKEWYDIVSDPYFIAKHHHLSSSSAGIIIQDYADPHLALYLEKDDDITGFKLTEFGIPFPSAVLGSCNGLVLLQDLSNPEVLHLMNMVTKEDISLPPLVGLESICTYYTTLAFTPPDLYKVVHVSRESCSFDAVQIMVFTVGIDKTWRIIDVEGIPMTKLAHTTLSYPPCFIVPRVYLLGSF